MDEEDDIKSRHCKVPVRKGKEVRLFGFGKKNNSEKNSKNTAVDERKKGAEQLSRVKKYGKNESLHPEFLINGTVLEKYNGSDTEVIIPDGITEIGYIAFEDSDIKSLTIPKSVARYHSGAFRISKVNKIMTSNLIPQDILGRTLVLKSDFDREDVMIPANDQMELEEIIVEEGNGSYAAVDGILYDKSMKRLLRCPPKKKGKVVIADGVERIRPRAFSKCDLIEKLIIPHTIKHPTVFGDLYNLRTVSVDEALFSPLCEYFPNSDKIEDTKFHHEYAEASDAQEVNFRADKADEEPYQICKKCGRIQPLSK